MWEEAKESLNEELNGTTAKLANALSEVTKLRVKNVKDSETSQQKISELEKIIENLKDELIKKSKSSSHVSFNIHFSFLFFFSKGLSLALELI